MADQKRAENRSLISPGLTSLPLGSIKPRGWVKDELQLSADGLAGHEFEFYRFVANSTWLGGTFEYSELNEAAPYWFNFIVPLAYSLDDQRLKSQAKYFLDYTLAHQADDGWLGPEKIKATRGLWARSLLFFGLIQYAEAEPTEAERIVGAMYRFVDLAHTMLQSNYTGLLQHEGDNFDPYGFGLSRTHELPMSLQWLYENYPRNDTAKLWETMELMFEGGRLGHRDWTSFFVKGTFPEVGTPYITTSGFTHGVNLAEGLRYPTVLYRMNGNESLMDQTYEAAALLEQYHSSRSGSIIADEHLGSLSPQRGSELCMAVESMFSFSYLSRFYRDGLFADKAERAAFNALPAAISPDWWSHQYVTQTNQPWSRNLSSDPFFNVVSYSNTFGLEPNFPCCTVNHPQGYPKYLASSYARDKSNGIVNMLLGPSSLTTSIASKRVSVECDTMYPFSGSLLYKVDSETAFELYVKIPGWTIMNTSYYQIDDGQLSALSPDAKGLQKFHVPGGSSTINLNLSMAIEANERNGTVAIYRGPILYALDIEYEQQRHQPLNFTDRMPLSSDQINAHTFDWTLTPTSIWKFAIDPSSLSLETSNIDELQASSSIWDRDVSHTAIWADGYPIEWNDEKDTAGLPPTSIVVVGSKKRVKLIPYGAAKLHIAEFPIYKI